MWFVYFLSSSFLAGYVFWGRAYVKLPRSNWPVAIARVFDRDLSKLASFCWDRDLDLWALFDVFIFSSFRIPFGLSLSSCCCCFFLILFGFGKFSKWIVLDLIVCFDIVASYGICLFWLNLLKSDVVVVFCLLLLTRQRICREHLFSGLVMFVLFRRLGIDHWYFNLVPLSLIYKHSLTTVNVHWSPQNWQTKVTRFIDPNGTQNKRFSHNAHNQVKLILSLNWPNVENAKLFIHTYTHIHMHKYALPFVFSAFAQYYLDTFVHSVQCINVALFFNRNSCAHFTAVCGGYPIKKSTAPNSLCMLCAKNSRKSRFIYTPFQNIKLSVGWKSLKHFTKRLDPWLCNFSPFRFIFNILYGTGSLM